MDIARAQAEMRETYVAGGPGVVISGLVWLIASLVHYTQGIVPGFAALFVGGMAIFPLSMLVCRGLFRRPRESPANPLSLAAMEGTMPMIGGLFAAWLLLMTRPALAFPVAAIAIGTRYAIFRTIYGDRTFWLLAGLISAIGLGDVLVAALHGITPVLVALVEVAMGIFLTARGLKRR